MFAIVRAWIKSYAGVIFICAIIAFSAIFFVMAYEAEKEKLLHASLLYEIAGTLATAGFTAILFGFTDVVSFASRMIAASISNSAFLEKLSPNARRELLEKIIEIDIDHSVTQIHRPLLSRALDLMNSHVSGPYWTNYSYKNDIAAHSEFQCFVADCSVRYTVHVRHLRKRPYRYKLKYSAEWDVKHELVGKVHEIIEEFQITAGSQKWGKSEAAISLVPLPTGQRVKIDFEKFIDLHDDVDVTMRSVAFQDSIDPVDLMYFSYPVLGFSASLNHDGGRDWQDASVFRPGLSGEMTIGCGSPIIKTKSVEFSCGGEWAFPGSGFVFVFPHAPASAPSTKRRRTPKVRHMLKTPISPLASETIRRPTVADPATES